MILKKDDKFAHLSDSEQETVVLIRKFGLLLGRAVSLSVVAATSNKRMEDFAMEAADRAWTDLADAVIEFAVTEDA